MAVFDGAVFDGPDVFDTGVVVPAAKWQGKLRRRRILTRYIGQRAQNLTEDEAIALAAALGMDPGALSALLAATDETIA